MYSKWSRGKSGDHMAYDADECAQALLLGSPSSGRAKARFTTGEPGLRGYMYGEKRRSFVGSQQKTKESYPQDK